MYIIYDARHFEDYYSGLSRYSFSVLKELISDDGFTRLDIIFNDNYDYSSNPLFSELKSLVHVQKIKFIFIKANIFSLKQHFSISKYVNMSNCDVYFYPHFDSPIFIKKSVVFVIHDLFPLVLDSYVLKLPFLKKTYFKIIILINLLRKNTKCIAVSETTKKDLMKYFGARYKNKIKVLYEDSFSDGSLGLSPSDEVSKVTKNKDFLFYIGGRRRHKNLKQMIDIFNLLKKNKLYQGSLLIAGSAKDFYFELDEYIRNNEHIIVLGKISDTDLSYLYSKMDALFFLSKYEGFGLPIIEAAKFNKKIITTNLGACGEIAPPNSLTLDITLENDKLAEQVSLYLNGNVEIDNSQYLLNFSWLNTVDFLLLSGRK